MIIFVHPPAQKKNGSDISLTDGGCRQQSKTTGSKMLYGISAETTDAWFLPIVCRQEKSLQERMLQIFTLL
jgi:hypothetical protein